ncbi:MAG: sensor histidine kinase [Pseudomonadota bacterium]
MGQPSMIRKNFKLWVRLWFAYAIVAFLGVSTVLAVSSVIFERARHADAYTQANLELFLSTEIQSGMWSADPAPSPEVAEETLERLLLLRTRDRQFDGRVIGRTGDPQAAVLLSDTAGNLFVQSVSDRWRDNRISDELIVAEAQVPGIDRVLTVKLHAPFSYATTIYSTLRFLPEQTIGVFLVSTILGLLCGIVAARYVTRRLALMDKATAQWSQGNFRPKIELASGDELGVHAERLNAMSRELEASLAVKEALAVSNERTQLARDLHDTVKQNLFALGLQLASLRDRLEKAGTLDEGQQQRLTEAEQINRDAQNDLVEIIAQLRTSDEGEETLGEKLRANALRLRKKFDIAVNVDIRGDMRVNSQTGHDLVRTVGELITNAVRHGRADTVDITLKGSGEIALLSVLDNGSGFATDQPRSGLGLQSVAGRIEALPSGQFTIKSDIGSGARAQIKWRHASG